MNTLQAAEQLMLSLRNNCGIILYRQTSTRVTSMIFGGEYYTKRGAMNVNLSISNSKLDVKVYDSSKRLVFNTVYSEGRGYKFDSVNRFIQKSYLS